jgi:hypothetical protein
MDSDSREPSVVCVHVACVCMSVRVCLLASASFIAAVHCRSPADLTLIARTRTRTYTHGWSSSVCSGHKARQPNNSSASPQGEKCPPLLLALFPCCSSSLLLCNIRRGLHFSLHSSRVARPLSCCATSVEAYYGRQRGKSTVTRWPGRAGTTRAVPTVVHSSDRGHVTAMAAACEPRRQGHARATMCDVCISAQS